MKPPVVKDGTIHFLGEQIIPLGSTHFLMESWTEPNEHHSVDSETWECSCPGWQFSRFCRHIEVIRRLIRSDFLTNQNRQSPAEIGGESPPLLGGQSSFA